MDIRLSLSKEKSSRTTAGHGGIGPHRAMHRRLFEIEPRGPRCMQHRLREPCHELFWFRRRCALHSPPSAFAAGACHWPGDAAVYAPHGGGQGCPLSLSLSLFLLSLILPSLSFLFLVVRFTHPPPPSPRARVTGQVASPLRGGRLRVFALPCGS